MANVFWLKDTTLYTPSLKTGCLPGTTREYIIENLKCSEVEATMNELNSVDAIFLTSAGIGVVQISEFEGRVMEKNPHEILELILKPI
jgi:branched-subunit amino acid aminotransferase/4-amino-4-deoxychorismate lyase